MRTALIVGKFMPLHRGHELLIQTAMANADEVTVVVYDMATPVFVPVEQRMKWISKLYPDLYNIVARKDPVIGDVDRNSADFAKLYADDLDFLGKFDYVFSSEDYGQQFAEAMGATHVTVDAARQLMPISGTTIREDPFKYRAFMSPVVYRDLVQKVVFVGTESSGKSTIAKRMAEEFDTQWVHEYGRELWEAQGLTGSFHDLLKIAETHYRREESMALNSRKYLFCDTNPWTTLQWSTMYSGSADSRLLELVERTKNEYVWIVCDNDFGWVDDNTRELVGDRSVKFQSDQINNLEKLGVVYDFIHGSVDERVAQVKDILAIEARL